MDSALASPVALHFRKYFDRESRFDARVALGTVRVFRNGNSIDTWRTYPSSTWRMTMSPTLDRAAAVPPPSKPAYAPALRQAEVGIAVSTATDVAKGAASVVLTEPGLTNIVALVEQGRTIYQRILTWIVNKISRTILKAAFVAIAYVVTSKFVVSAFAMLLLTFTTDFAKIALATDHVRSSRRPETWNIGGFITVSVILGVAMVAEALLFLRIGWSRFGLATDDGALYTFSFLLLLYFAVFSVVSARERH
jgi:H+-transporting ATPase